MESTVKERLIRFIKSKGLSQKKFEQVVGLSNGYVNNISRSIGADKMQSILCAFPELNQTWLLTGEGEMLIKKSVDIPGVVRASELSESPPRKERPPSVAGMLPEATFKFAAGQTLLVNERETVNRYWYLPDCTDCEAVDPSG